ncbi:MAG TPA: Rieske 2Fe-2S domain-containing protein [Pirellulaceae bacterium]|jgi:nitrite reductase/ring-hydroxylating ferredoxin subunit|nr:Rieske 2Fe-2S domain-containing protein [Pirellulaceae bacterium]
MTTWHRVIAARDCPPGTGMECVTGDRVVALFNVDGQFYALDGICPHQGGPLGKGVLSGCVVTCPWHGWQFDVTTGQHQISKTLVHSHYATKVEGEDVLVSFDAW